MALSLVTSLSLYARSENNIQVVMESCGDQDQKCPLCDFECGQSQLEYHIREHTQEKPFQCDQCNCRFARQSSIYPHKQRVHQEQRQVYKKNYKCSLCPFETHSKCHLKIHKRTHADERNFPCQHPNCGYAAKTSFFLRRHSSQKHSSERRFLCPFPNCDYRGKIRSVMRQHSETHSDVKPFACDFAGCSYRAKRKPAITFHKASVHSGGHKPFACSMCNHRTTNKRALRNHQLTHSEEKPVKCTFSGCGFSCKFNAALKEHVLNRHTDRKFRCDFAGCSSTAASQSQLNKHKKLAHYGKIYKCPSCDHQAAKPFDLRKHLEAVHGKNQRIPCPQKGCTFLARHRPSFNAHMRHHKSNLACPVDGCGYVGISSSAIKRHMQMHDPNGRPFHCPFCPKHFCNRTQFSLHLHTHTEEKHFKCPICKYGSAVKGQIIRHIGKIHSTIFPNFIFDEQSICDHCNLNFGCAVGLAIHEVKLRTAVVVLSRLQLKLDS